MAGLSLEDEEFTSGEYILICIGANFPQQNCSQYLQWWSHIRRLRKMLPLKITNSGFF